MMILRRLKGHPRVDPLFESFVGSLKWRQIFREKLFGKFFYFITICFSSFIAFDRVAWGAETPSVLPFVSYKKSAINSPVGKEWPIAPPAEAVPPSLKPRFMRPLRILLDAGHGGKDYGAKSPLGIDEKTLCLKLVAGIRRELAWRARMESVPIEVRLTRSKDEFIALRRRVKIANDWNADLFVSVHANASFAPKAKGFEIYFMSPEASDAHTRRLVQKENSSSDRTLQPGILSILSDLRASRHIEESGRFARGLFQRMSRSLDPNVRGVRQGPFTVLTGTKMPAVLVEVGYLTNKEEARKLQSRGYLKRLVSAISSGIMEYALKLRRLG